MADPEPVETEQEIVAEIIPEASKEDDFPWAVDDDERRRAFVFVQLTESAEAVQVEGKILVQNMECIWRWLRDGTVPGEKTTKLSALTSQSIKPKNT